MTESPESPRLPGPASPAPVVLKRRRWDLYFLPAMLAAAAFGAVVAAATGEMKPLVAPVPLGLLWWLMRAATPRDGMRALPLDAGMRRLLYWSGLMLFSLLAVEALDGHLTGRGFGAAYQPYHLALQGMIVVVFLLGTFVLARRIDRRRQRQGRAAL
jgi:hypothetical protein